MPPAFRLSLALICSLALSGLLAGSASAETVFRAGEPLPGGYEVVKLRDDGKRMAASDGANGVALVDTTSPNPRVVSTYSIEDELGESVSVAWTADDRWILAAFVHGDYKQGAGMLGTSTTLLVLDPTGDELTEVHRFPMPSQPDSIAVSPDGKYAAVAIEDEEEFFPGGGRVMVLDLADPDEPASWSIHEVPLSLPPTFPDFELPQPEYVDFNADGEFSMSIQEQNAIGIFDAEAAVDDDPGTDPLLRYLDAGEVTYNKINLEGGPPSLEIEQRQPDAVQWTEDGEALVTADEGETAGAATWSILDATTGAVIYTANENYDRNAALYGQYNGESNSQPEGVDVEMFRGREYAFIVAERSANVSIYDITSRAAPRLMVVLPTGNRPETVDFNPEAGFGVTGNETARDSSVFAPLERSQLDPDRPLIKGDEPWLDLSGMAAISPTSMLAVTNDVPRRVRRIDLTDLGEASLSTLQSLPPTAQSSSASRQVEDLVPDGEGGVWIAGRHSPEILRVDETGAEIDTIDLPNSLDPYGLAMTADGTRLVVAETTGEAGVVEIATKTLTEFDLAVVELDGQEVEYTDLETAPDGRIVALAHNDAQFGSLVGVAGGFYTFSVDGVATDQVVTPDLQRAINRADLEPYGTDNLAALAVAPNGDVFHANGALFENDEGSNPGFRRVKGVFPPPPPPPPPAAVGLPSQQPSDAPLVGHDFLHIGGQLYGWRGGPGEAIATPGNPNGPNAAIISGQDGRTTGLPDVDANNTVWAFAPDGTGGFYMVGDFTEVNGQERRRIAHVLADGALDPDFTPTLNSQAVGVAFVGGRIWIGGFFTQVNGVSRSRLVALLPDGTIDPSTNLDASTALSYLELVDGKLYVSASSSSLTIGGETRGRLARIDLDAPGGPALDTFAPNPSSTVSKVAVDGADVILGGEFTNIDGAPASQLAIVDGTTGALIEDLNSDAPVRALLVQGRTLWAAGDLNMVNGTPVRGLARIDLDDPSTVTSFPAGQGPDRQISAVVPLTGGRLLLTGNFGEIFGRPSTLMAAIDAATFAEDPAFVGRASGSAVVGGAVLPLPGDRLAIGGAFSLVGIEGPAGGRLIRIDRTTGQPDPSFSEFPVDAFTTFTNRKPQFATDGEYIYAANGKRFDRHTGALDPTWSFTSTQPLDNTPSYDEIKLIPFGDDLYLVGDFTRINTSNRNGIAAIDRTSATVTAFNPRTGTHAVTDMVITPDGRMFITGDLEFIRDQPTGGIAEVDPQTGELLPTFEGITPEFGENPRLAFDPATETLYVSGVTGLDESPAGGIVAFDVSGDRPERLADFAPVIEDNEQISAMIWALDHLIVAQDRGGQINGVDYEAGGYALTADGKIAWLALGDTSQAGFNLSAVGSEVVVHNNLFLPAPPANETPPVIVGTPQEGLELTCDPGQWDGAPGFAFEWLRGGEVIEGAADPTYSPGAGDVGTELSCRVTGSNQLGEETATSAAVGPVTVGVPFSGAAPEITGTPLAGETLTASTGAWSNDPDSFSYQWLVDGEAIDPPATGGTYEVAPADAGREISVRVIATNAQGESAPASSEPLRIAAVPTSSAPPQITGTAAVGGTLSAEEGEWSAEPSEFTYQWLRDGTAIEGATEPTYTPAVEDEGREIAVEVVASTLAGDSEPARSGAVQVALPDAPVNLGPPIVEGRAILGETLTCGQGAWLGERIEHSWRWLRSGQSVDGATAPTYTLAEADLGRTVSCQVTAANPGGATTAESASISPQQPPPPPGQSGQDGQDGTAGPQGPVGAQGHGGAKGDQGPGGAKGDRGARGQAGRDARVTCQVRGPKGRQRVTCKVTRGGKRAAKSRARLMRGGRVYARGTLNRLRPTRELAPGRYVLRVGSGRGKATLRVKLR